jgi:putative phosphoribosyl transferase
VVLFAHGSGSSRRSPRNQFVARRLQSAGLGTLLFDLMTPAEERKDQDTGYWRFNITLLAERLVTVTRWLLAQPSARHLAPGYFGASTGAAAALVAAAELGTAIRAVVSRGGRPDLAGEALAVVTAPTLLIVGEADHGVLNLNRHALSQMTALAELAVVPRATHLFEEPGALRRRVRPRCPLVSTPPHASTTAMTSPFAHRTEAGRQLARLFATPTPGPEPLVLGLPRRRARRSRGCTPNSMAPSTPSSCVNWVFPAKRNWRWARSRLAASAPSTSP